MALTIPDTEAPPCQGVKHASNMKPDMILYGAVMSACLLAAPSMGDLVSAISNLPFEKVAEEFAHSCEKARQWRRALAAFAEAADRGLEPGLVATSIAITAYGRGALWEKSIQTLRQLSDNGLQPNVVTYNATISACERGQQSRPALALLCEMPEAEVPPDLISYNAAINACEKASDWQAALEVFLATPRELPNEITYNTAISACHKGSHWQGSVALFKTMEARALAPNVITHSATMASCLRGDAWQKALELYGQLPLAEREGNPIMVGLMLQALGAAKAWEEALAHLQRLAKPGSRAVDALCFTAAVRTCGACGPWEWAVFLLDKMQGHGFLPDVVTATLVLSACRQAGQWQAALRILRETMPSLGIEPGTSSIRNVLGACFEANQLDVGLELLKESPLLRAPRRGQKLPLAAVLIQAQLLLGLRTQILIQAPRLVTNFMAFMVKLNGKCKFLQEVNQPRILRNAATRCGTWPPRRCGRRRSGSQGTCWNMASS
ncbi:unnamed protein product [Symbiodinium natans]|uniref:Pentatricopeptide repeat-containing protein, chloroplastic n=1 Tax=Symbiodinium natans TaxID=878477 RepID=A0A812SZK9_9DINO|nr:unnamed protein product [Symbiodinium natans]